MSLIARTCVRSHICVKTFQYETVSSRWYVIRLFVLIFGNIVSTLTFLFVPGRFISARRGTLCFNSHTIIRLADLFIQS